MAKSAGRMREQGRDDQQQPENCQRPGRLPGHQTDQQQLDDNAEAGDFAQVAGVGPGVDGEHAETGDQDNRRPGGDVTTPEQAGAKQDEAGQMHRAQGKVEPALAGKIADAVARAGH